MAQVTQPIVLDTTGQRMASALENLAGGQIVATTTDPGEGAAMTAKLLIVYAEDE